jgi:hypothetical protein
MAMLPRWRKRGRASFATCQVPTKTIRPRAPGTAPARRPSIAIRAALLAHWAEDRVAVSGVTECAQLLAQGFRRVSDFPAPG